MHSLTTSLLFYLLPRFAMHLMPSPPRARCWAAALAGGAVFVGAALGVRRVRRDRRIGRVKDELLAPSVPLERFSPGRVAGFPEPARRYLVHAIAPGTPLAPAVRLQMDGAMRPAPGSPQLSLVAEETLAPRRGFVWTARTRLFGLPVRVRDRYFDREGSVRVLVLGGIPLPSAGGEDVTRSSRGRLVAEAVWCPTALVAPGVAWDAEGPDRARFTLVVDGDAVSVTLRVGPDGALREVTLNRWGDVGVPSFRALPYGFKVEEEAAFGGVTIPTRLRGGWWYGTDRYEERAAATFTVRSAAFAGVHD